MGEGEVQGPGEGSARPHMQSEKGDEGGGRGRACISDRDLLCSDSCPIGLFVYGSLFESVYRGSGSSVIHTNLGGFYLIKFSDCTAS